MVRSAPVKKRVVAFFDCQNLFQAVKGLWGYTYPNFDPIKLAKMIVKNHSSDRWALDGIRLYTGIHEHAHDKRWHTFWTNKLNAHRVSDSRVFAFTTPLRYTDNIPREKGIDVRIAIDLVVMAIDGMYDVALLFSQDNDLAQAAAEIRTIVQKQQRWIKIASAYPYQPECANPRGVNQTDWIRISKTEYDACVDHTKY